MDNELTKRIEALEAKIDKVYESAERTRKYFMWTLIVTIVLFVLPLFGVLSMLSSFMDTYSAIGDLGI